MIGCQVPAIEAVALQNKSRELTLFLEARKDDQESNKILSDFKCDQCSYKAQKLNTLNKHINSKQTKQKCKVCKKEFNTSME